MKKSEIDEFLETSFKKIGKYFHKSIAGFDTESIREFRTEIKRLKVFLHLISMESADGLACRITKRMKTLYGYFGIIRNLETQLSETKKYAQSPTHNAPAHHIHILEKELQYWKKLSLDFIDAGYSFNNDKQEIMAGLPDRLNKKSIKKFVHYTLYELHTLSGRADDDALDSIRKFIEDIYYNYEIISPFFDERQCKILNKKTIEECLKLFDDFRNKCISLVLLQTFLTDELDESEKQLMKTMEKECLNEKKDIKHKLIAALDSMNVKAVNLNSFVIAGVDDD
ncbi:MAG TPA: CHAD domain-containing protein [Hanamia sp.]|nr:CHAD domain-containing protein [Hanamia sp.]